MSSESKTPAVAVLPAGGAPAPGSAADAVERTLFEAGLPLPARPVNGFMRHHLATHIMPQAVVPISRGITIRPRMLAENLRAGSFPDEVQSIAVSAGVVARRILLCSPPCHIISPHRVATCPPS